MQRIVGGAVGSRSFDVGIGLSTVDFCTMYQMVTSTFKEIQHLKFVSFSWVLVACAVVNSEYLCGKKHIAGITLA